MINKDFSEILQGAVSGNHDDLEELLKMYMPLINKYSYFNGELDEDMRQYIMIHIALNISKFSI
ncbi:MAG: helix-turn-helix domain-containing protein [Ruminococcus flavefaciens]|nr:helix-turn-helix domain-containing protein [Ruminococcus flavefaciens]